MYRWVAWLIAVVFVFNGAVSQASIELPAPATVAGQHAMAAAVGHDRHRHDAGDLAAARADHDQTANHIDKCCVACKTASMAPEAIVTAVVFSSVAVRFFPSRTDLVGHLVVLDPDIPKTLV